jgi:hypothetical protein
MKEKKLLFIAIALSLAIASVFVFRTYQNAQLTKKEHEISRATMVAASIMSADQYDRITELQRKLEVRKETLNLMDAKLIASVLETSVDVKKPRDLIKHLYVLKAIELAPKIDLDAQMLLQPVVKSYLKSCFANSSPASRAALITAGIIKGEGMSAECEKFRNSTDRNVKEASEQCISNLGR